MCGWVVGTTQARPSGTPKTDPSRSRPKKPAKETS
nr:MAG TPA: hypothetical protein [Caudoviricetes sp.]